MNRFVPSFIRFDSCGHRLFIYIMSGFTVSMGGDSSMRFRDSFREIGIFKNSSNLLVLGLEGI